MIVQLEQGESFPAPCRHCFHVSVVVVASAGTTVQRCPKCLGETRFIVEARAEGWEFRSQVLWLLPVTGAEVQYKKTNGIDALEERFEEARLNYLDPLRNSVIEE